MEPIVISAITLVGKSAKNAGTAKPKRLNPDFPRSSAIPDKLKAKGITTIANAKENKIDPTASPKGPIRKDCNNNYCNF